MRLKKDELADLKKKIEATFNNQSSNFCGHTTRNDISILNKENPLSLREQLILYRGIEIGLTWALGIKDKDILYLEEILKTAHV